MKFSELCKKVRSGEIELVFAGHRVNGTKESFLERYDETVAIANGSNDGKWNTNKDTEADLKKLDADMRSHFQRRLDCEIIDGDERYNVLSDYSTGSRDEYCFECGQELKWTLVGGKLYLNRYFDGNQFKNNPIDFLCPFLLPQPFKGEIKVTSTLLFANFFRDIPDAPEEVQYDREWSLNSTAGRKKITEYKASKNVAYGQVTNTSVGIYINEAMTSIIVGPAYHPAEMGEYETDKEYYDALKAPVFEGYRKVKGDISCCVWRWEATDKDTLGKQGYKALLAQVKESCTGLIKIDVPHGIWEFEHYFRTQSGDNEHMYARLNLKTPA